MSENKSFKRKNSNAWRTIKGTTFLVSPAMKKIYPLNDVGQAVWLGLEQSYDFESLVNKIYQEFDADLETIKNDVREFLENMLNDGLIENLN